MATIAWCLALPHPAIAQDMQDLNAVYQISAPPNGITGLTWVKYKWEAQATHADTNPVIWVRIEGVYNHKDWHLLNAKKQLIKLDARGAFKIWVPLRADRTQVEFLAIAPSGDIERETEILKIPKMNFYMAKLKEEAGRKRFSLLAGIGPTFISYKQTNLNQFSESVITAKISYAYRFPGNHYDFAANFFGNLLVLSSGLPGSSISFYGFNGRLAYVIPGIAEPWRFTVSAGIYYLLAKSSGPVNFGFNNLAGPQVFPTLTRVFKNGDRAWGYFKYSPVSDNFSITKLSNREIATGVGWAHALEAGHALAYTFDVSALHFETDTGASLDSSTISLGVSYSY